MLKLLEEVSFLRKESLLENIETFNEAYYGGNKLLDEVDVEMEKIKKMVESNKNPNGSDSITKIENNFKKLFGFEKVIFTIIPNKKFMNAFTVPVFNEKLCPSKEDYLVTKTKEGIKFKNPKGKELYIYMYSYTLRTCTARQCTSIALHEVGHNFFLVEDHYKFIKLKAIIGQILQVIMLFIQSPDKLSVAPICLALLINLYMFCLSPQKYSYEIFSKQLNRFNSKNKPVGNFSRFFMNVKNVGKSVLGIVATPLVLLFSVPAILLNKAFKNIGYKEGGYDYDAEKFSDNFAMTFGYGVEVAEVFNNMKPLSVNEEELKKHPVIASMHSVTEAMSETLSYLADPHPARQKRVQMALDKMKYELKHNKSELTPTLIKECEEQIKKLEVIVKESAEARSVLVRFVQDKLGLVKDADDIKSNYSDEEIFDFDKQIIKSHIVESLVIGEGVLAEAYNLLEGNLEQELIEEESDIDEEIDELLESLVISKNSIKKLAGKKSTKKISSKTEEIIDVEDSEEE